MVVQVAHPVGIVYGAVGGEVIAERGAVFRYQQGNRRMFRVQPEQHVVKAGGVDGPTHRRSITGVLVETYVVGSGPRRVRAGRMTVRAGRRLGAVTGRDQ